MMTLIESALILVYSCVLLIKACDTSEAVCAKFGFGDTANGIYLFFIFFGLSMVVALLIIAGIKVYLTGQLPTVILVARSHGVSPWSIIHKVAARRC